MSTTRTQPKEFRASLRDTAKLTYAEKLQDVRWKRKRDDLLRQSGYTCCECGQPLTCGKMDLQVHHVVYISCLDPWDYPDELLLVVCDWHHRERQAVEQAIFVEVGKHLAGLNVYEMRRQPIYSFFEEDSTLHLLPLWMRENLRYEHSLD
jgi:5-methylcytosine-specific restriction endonuclease McrA